MCRETVSTSFPDGPLNVSSIKAPLYCIFFRHPNINLKSVLPVKGSTEGPPDRILSFR